MTTQLRSPASTTSQDVDTQHADCAVCSHHLSDHDVIGLRYCEATQVNALSRGCICSPTHG
jgi:hypothetical protein